MFERLFRRFKKKKETPLLEQVQEMMSAECGAIRKILRKQALVVEEIREKLSGDKEREGQKQEEFPAEALQSLAGAFFHLERSFQGQLAFSPAHREAFHLFRLDLDHVLALKRISMIRDIGVPFDPRLHQAVSSAGSTALGLVVREVLQPGFLIEGKVRQPAKVTVGPASDPDPDVMGESFV